MLPWTSTCRLCRHAFIHHVLTLGLGLIMSPSGGPTKLSLRWLHHFTLHFLTQLLTPFISTFYSRAMPSMCSGICLGLIYISPATNDAEPLFTEVRVISILLWGRLQEWEGVSRTEEHWDRARPCGSSLAQEKKEKRAIWRKYFCQNNKNNNWQKTSICLNQAWWHVSGQLGLHSEPSSPKPQTNNDGEFCRIV